MRRPRGTRAQTVPLEAQAFYQDFGLLTNPATRKPSPNLTPYQREIWNDKSKYRLVVKSQKVGITTSALLEDFQRSITSPAKGKDILIIAQSQRHANEHIRTLKYLIFNSEKYSRYLITSIGEFTPQFKEEKTKVHVAYILNDDNLAAPTRIIGLGANESGVWSWKNVAHIHMSDIAASTAKDDSGLFAAMFSRLANTNGTLLIESPPRGPKGQIYQIYTESKTAAANAQGETQESQFKVFEVPAREAVASGLISQQFLDGEKQRLGSLYRQYYEAAFISAIYAAFDILAIEQAEADGQKIGTQPLNQYAPRCLGIDPGFGSSEFALTVLEIVPYLGNKTRVLYAQSFERATYEQMKSIAYQLTKQHDIDTVYVDAANPEFIKSLKTLLDEPIKYEDTVRAAQSKGYRLEDLMKVVPVNFRQEDKALLQHSKALIEAGEIAIHPDFTDLLNDLRIAQEINGGLDKRQGNRLDLVDSFRLACKFLRPVG